MNSKAKAVRRKRRSNGRGIGVAIMLVIAAAAVFMLLLKLGVLPDHIGPFTLYKRPAAADAASSVRFIDVGQGDCTLAVSDGCAMLIDSGESDSKDTVISYIRSLGIKRLEHIVITHPHSDHIGEMSDIAGVFEVGRILLPPVPEALETKAYSYEKLMKAARKRDIQVETARDQTFSLGSFEVTVTVPAQPGEDLNNCSLITRLTLGDDSFLITGDCGAEEEKALIEQGAVLDAEVLKVGHHGSSSASSERFLEQVRPRYAVISCAAGNDYGHPSEKTLRRLEKFVQQIYITRDSGTVTFTCDGGELGIYPEKTDE